MSEAPRGLRLGTIASLQVQREPLKKGRALERAYDPRPIVGVPAICIDETGAVGVRQDGSEILDVHNARHLDSRDPRGDRGLSLMSDADYRWMRARYGEHLPDGIAGETITLSGGPALRGMDLGAGVLIVTERGTVALTEVRPAAPCVEFVRYVLRREPGTAVNDAVKEALDVLDHGARGFVAVATQNGVISVGDEVHVAPE